MRIISLAPSNTEIVYALGLGDTIVGATEYCDYPSAAKAIPRVGSWINKHDTVKIEELKPDIILTSMFKPEEVQAWCDSHKIKLLHVDPHDVEGVYDSIITIGETLGKKDEASKIVSQMKEEAESVRKLALEQKPKIYSEEFPKPPTVGSNWVPELIETAGGVSMGQKGELSREVTAEEVYSFSPDMIILHWCGFGKNADPERVFRREDWRGLHAIKTGNVFVIDDALLNRPGPRLWQGAKEIQKLIEKFYE